MAIPESADAYGDFLADLGMWVSIAGSATAAARPALFLDRDGVIVEETGYLSQIAEMTLIQGASQVISLANRKGIPVVVVTNQAGIGRGYYGWKEFIDIERALAYELARDGAVVDGVFACPYHPNGVGQWAHPDHPARKPRPGMLLAAARFLNVDLAASWIVGDKLDDLRAGHSAQLCGAMHVLTGHGQEHRRAALAWNPPGFSLRLENSVQAAASLVNIMAEAAEPDWS